ncbi:MAG: ABC transporter permease [Gemmatimonadetes bacterium]|nr:ABC transporter permease [Gemmatimonadota bacterium]
MNDLRYALRSLRRRAGVTAALVITLALGIGSNTAVFSAVDRLLWHPLPFPDSDRMVFVWQRSPTGAMRTEPPVDVAEAWSRAPSFESSVTFKSGTVFLGVAEEGARVDGARVPAGFLAFLGVQPVIGRTFTADATAPGGANVALLSAGAWRRRFGADPEVLGRAITVNGNPYVIVGVVPASLTRLPLAGDAEVWLPLRSPDQTDEFAGATLLARLQPGVTVETAARELDAIRSRLVEPTPFFAGWPAHIYRVPDFLQDDLRVTLLVLLGAVALVLLVACANAAGLLLVRATARGRELAVRVALGARRGDLMRQLMVESGMLAAIAAVVGVGLAVLWIAVVVKLRPEDLSALDRVALDHRALAFTSGLSFLTMLLFGIVPALRGSQVRPSAWLKSDSPGSLGGGAHARFRTGLVVIQVALSVVLLVGAGLLMHTLLRLQRSDPGFRAENLLVARLELPASEVTATVNLETLVPELEAGARRLPGASAALVTPEVPLHYGVMGGIMQADGVELAKDAAAAPRAYARVPPGYFEVLGVPLLRGRGFEPRDVRGAARGEPVRIVSESLARVLAPDGDAVAMRIRIGERGTWATVVGVVQDVAASSLRREVRPFQLYAPFDPSNRFGDWIWLVVRTRSEVAGILPLVRPLVRAVDPNVSVREVATGRDLIAGELLEPRFYTILLAVFAGIALLLSAVGLYGVLSHSVELRTREIGVRMALGAAAAEVRGLVVRQAIPPAVGGLALGVGLSMVAARVLSSLLYEVQPADPPARALVALVIAATAALASWLPARRASKVDPVVALRYE